MRDNLDGRETRAQFGIVTNGGLKEEAFSQLAGMHWDSGNILTSFEYYRRSALWANDRRLATTDLAVRVENFNDFGQAVAPKMSLVYAPLEGLRLRASAADSFKARNMTNLVESNNGVQLINLPDPTAPSGSRATLLWYGNNKDLQAERARSWAVGADVSPRSIADLSVSLTYFDVLFRNRIQAIEPERICWKTPPMQAW